MSRSFTSRSPQKPHVHPIKPSPTRGSTHHCPISSSLEKPRSSGKRDTNHCTNDSSFESKPDVNLGKLGVAIHAVENLSILTGRSLGSLPGSPLRNAVGICLSDLKTPQILINVDLTFLFLLSLRSESGKGCAFPPPSPNKSLLPA